MARRSRRFRRNDAEYVWCGLLTNGNALGSAAAEENLIVEGADWFAGAGQGECVLQRIRGSVGFTATVGTESTNGAFQVAIYKAEEDASSYAVPWVADELVDEDILLFKEWMICRSATGIALPAPIEFDIDVPVKRRLRSNEGIRIMVATTGPAGTYHVATRALVRV